MRIVIIGAGKIGMALAGTLSGEGHEITLVDKSTKRLENAMNAFDVIGIEGNKINLSVKRLEAQSSPSGNRSSGAPRRENHAPRQNQAAPTPPPAPKTADQLFEERLKQFMSESDSKISSIRQYSDHRTKSRRR